MWKSFIMDDSDPHTNHTKHTNHTNHTNSLRVHSRILYAVRTKTYWVVPGQILYQILYHKPGSKGLYRKNEMGGGRIKPQNLRR